MQNQREPTWSVNWPELNKLTFAKQNQQTHLVFAWLSENQLAALAFPMLNLDNQEM